MVNDEILNLERQVRSMRVKLINMQQVMHANGVMQNIALVQILRLLGATPGILDSEQDVIAQTIADLREACIHLKAGAPQP